MSQESYLKEAQEYHDQVWNQAMKKMMSRRLFMKASTLAAAGGASAINGLLSACAGGGEETIMKETEEYEYSRYPLVDKYHWRRLEWGGTPYIDGILSTYDGGWSDYDTVHKVKSSGGKIWQLLMHTQYGAGASMELLEMASDLADKVSHAPDYSYFDYHIRPECYFHDIPPVNGRKLTAEDVRYSLELYRTDSVYTALLNFFEKFEILPDGETIRAHLRRPVLFSNHVLGSANCWIIAKEHFEGDDKRWKQQPIGSGPFKITKSKYRGPIMHERHEGYGYRDDRWKGYKLPFMKKIEGNYIGDAAARKSAFRTKQVDNYGSSGDYTGFNDLLATNLPGTRIQVQAPNSGYGPHAWYVRNDKKPFNDVRVRRAMTMAIDKQAMIDTVYGGMASPSYPISYNFMGRTDPLTIEELGPWQQYNPTRAKELLAEAGYPNGFEMEKLTIAPVPDHDLLTAKFLEGIGIRVKFNTVENTVYYAARAKREYKDAMGGYYPSALHGVKVAREMFLPGSKQNLSWVDDPVMTDLVEKATYTLDADEQMRLLKKINERALDQCYAIERVCAFYWTMWHSWVKNCANATSGWWQYYGNWQMAVTWIDDTAPSGRGGRLKT